MKQSRGLDFDADGQPDAIVRVGSGREPTRYLYLMKGQCGRYLGKVDAFMLGCSGARHGGLCELWVDTWLMHGDRLRRRMHFFGGRYHFVDQGEVIRGPRWRR